MAKLYDGELKACHLGIQLQGCIIQDTVTTTFDETVRETILYIIAIFRDIVSQ